MCNLEETIKELKEVDLFDEFKSAMEIIVTETSKPQIEWDDGELNCDGLKYNPDDYRNFYENKKEGYYDDKPDEYLEDSSAFVGLELASSNTETYKSFYCDSYHDDCKISGLDFGCITWNPYLELRGAYDFDGYNENDSTAYYDYINKVTDISFSCFHGKTPQQILDILNEVK